MKKSFMALMLALMLLLVGCGTEAVKTCDLAAASAVLTETYALDSMMALTADDLLELYGIAAADAKQSTALIAEDSLSYDTVLIFEAADKDALTRLTDKLNARYQAMQNETKDYLPDEYAKVSACKVESDGNFVWLIVSTEAEAMTKTFREQFK